MEADSTTCDNISKTKEDGNVFPFPVHPGNFTYYSNIVNKEGEGSIESRLIQSLQSLNLIPSEVKCPKGTSECCLNINPARVVDRFQWICVSCGMKVPVRYGSFFFRLPCSLLQALQMILAWCEDADWDQAAQHFGVKQKAAISIYDKLDEIAVEEQRRYLLGGPNNVVLAEMYPDCLNRLSPDTTEHPHVHRVLMLADTKSIPTRYSLRVVKDKTALNNTALENKILATEVREIIAQKMAPGSTLVVGNYVPLIEGASTLQNLLQHCDIDMQQFLCNRIWRQAVTVCAASRDLCVPPPPTSTAAAAAAAASPAPHHPATSSLVCALSLQKYFDTSLFRLRHDDGFLQHMLRLIADKYSFNYKTYS